MDQKPWYPGYPVSIVTGPKKSMDFVVTKPNFRTNPDGCWARKPAMWGPSSLAKLVNITPITMIYGTYNYSSWGFINQFMTFGGPTL